jgi:hypothetical protein
MEIRLNRGSVEHAPPVAATFQVGKVIGDAGPKAAATGAEGGAFHTISNEWSLYCRCEKK